MMDLPDRLDALGKQGNVAGLDFVRVEGAAFDNGAWHVTLQAFFHPLKASKGASDVLGNLGAGQIQIRSATGDDAQLTAVPCEPQWPQKNTLAVEVQVPLERVGGEYALSIVHEWMDPYFNHIPFSFRAACPRDVDCLYSVRAVPSKEEVDFPIDYEARDYASFRRALLDFAAQRYPHWADRLEADLSIMLVEVLSALGDEFAYYQDRIGREAYLETATQRRSVRCHARLVDYAMHNGLAASTWLCGKAGTDGVIFPARAFGGPRQ